MNTSWDQNLWRARALRYTLIYLLLGGVLVGLRFQTRTLRPELLEVRGQLTMLTQQKQALQLEIQARTSSARVREWALANEMVPFSRARKSSAQFEPLPDVAPPAPHRPLEVQTRWK
ncbi:hypothetical protein [Deinococcus peraridilitoris]|uniref:Cell division protein FtsL n=1 Tax=Deinococcus peraridilitoris (strain DSM 19664 / LMG 22246 / CIP 109416 / KR-200) TaxID=937777 RepID=L0A4I2_DEIPD|nr:hypothetical protein [Deinococcus peraridilitoris]AFZ68756.1 hypothetical protein Deipe_3316 [Deinococcus peraridilitoris DSM 19664]